jgi:hypothetical protein
MPQAQSAQQRLKHTFAPPSYGQVSSSSKVHRREGYLASVQMNLVIFTCSCANLPSALLLPRQRRVAAGSGLSNGLGTTIKYLRWTRNGAAGNGLSTTIKYL